MSFEGDKWALSIAFNPEVHVPSIAPELFAERDIKHAFLSKMLPKLLPNLMSEIDRHSDGIVVLSITATIRHVPTAKANP